MKFNIKDILYDYLTFVPRNVPRCLYTVFKIRFPFSFLLLFTIYIYCICQFNFNN